jgi:PAS domain-containing protein
MADGVIADKTKTVLSLLAPEDRAALTALYEEALAKFGKSATVIVMIAGFQLEWGRNVFLTLKFCSTAMGLEPSVEEEFCIRVLRVAALAHEARTVPGAAAANMQLEFRKRTAAAETAVLTVARSKQRFFSGLRAPVVDLGDVLAISREFMTALDSAIAQYKAALVLQPRSVGTMRAYAALLMGVNDSATASQLIEAADAMEEARNKHSARMFQRTPWAMTMVFDVGLETNAVIQVAIDPRRVGAILTVNAEACRLFGYSQQVQSGIRV